MVIMTFTDPGDSEQEIANYEEVGFYDEEKYDNFLLPNLQIFDEFLAVIWYIYQWFFINIAALTVDLFLNCRCD